MTERRMTEGPRRVALLHTASLLVPRFESLLAASIPGVEVTHVVDPGLLRTAVEQGVTDDLSARVADQLAHLEAGGAEAILVTCSSIGEAVEAAASSARVPILRVDAPMAARAVDIAARAGAAEARPGRIAVLATLSATLGPTGRLIAAMAAGTEVETSASVVAGAIEAREAGDRDRHDALIREAATDAAESADVVVLAQASMAGALDDATLGVPVLSSPSGGVEALARALGAANAADNGRRQSG